jgi:glucokinase
MKSYAIGIDVGGTKIAGGVVDLDSGRVLTRQVLPTRAERGGQAVLDDVLALDTALRAEAERMDTPILGTGLGVCELVGSHGQITSDQTIAWIGIPVRERLMEHGPAMIESDVRAHALAEARYGAGRNFRIVTFVTVGTGISSCLVLDGQPFAGARGNALVLASSPLTFLCTACGALQRPILEEFASGLALGERYRRATGRAHATGKDVLAAAQAGDTIAFEIVRSAAVALGSSIGWLVNVLDPEAVIVGGGLGTAGGQYWDMMVDSVREHVWSAASRDLPVLMAALGPDAGLIGAASLMSIRA